MQTREQAYGKMVQDFGREAAFQMVSKLIDLRNACKIDAAWYESTDTVEDDTFPCPVCC